MRWTNLDKIKRFLDCYIPTETCNLRCHYCYIAQKKKFNQKLAKFPYPKEVIRKALSRQRLGGPCLLNLCAGGETLLAPDVLPVVRELLEEGHYVTIVTNGTLAKRFEEVQQWPREICSRLMFKMSFHYLELVRLNLLDVFFDNIQRIKQCGASFTVEITPSDELIPHIEEVKKICLERVGALCHVTIARNDRKDGKDILSAHTFEEYKAIWGQFDSDLFRFKSEIYQCKRKEFCYAGIWSMHVNMGTGDVNQCYGGNLIDNIYADVDKPLHFKAIGYGCRFAYCYNGHAFLTLGDIPELQTPTYAQLRNRVCEDGSEWLTPETRAFFESKLCESNKPYSFMKKAACKLEDFEREAASLSKRTAHRVKQQLRGGKSGQS